MVPQLRQALPHIKERIEGELGIPPLNVTISDAPLNQFSGFATRIREEQGGISGEILPPGEAQFLQPSSSPEASVAHEVAELAYLNVQLSQHGLRAAQVKHYAAEAVARMYQLEHELETKSPLAQVLLRRLEEAHQRALNGEFDEKTLKNRAEANRAGGALAYAAHMKFSDPANRARLRAAFARKKIDGFQEALAFIQKFE